MKKNHSFIHYKFFNIENKYKYLFFSLLLFCIGFIIIAKYSNYIPIHENTITDYIQGDDLPFFKNNQIFYDLSYSLIIFIILFKLFDNIKSSFLRKNIKIIWIIKSFFSLFLILIYEKDAGLDQVVYFDIINNQKVWAQHYGYIFNFINFESATSNFLIPFKYLNFVFIDSWFLIKIFLNLIYISTVYISYKIYLKINPINSFFIFYSFSFFPTLFFYSSILTKDLFILFYILVSFYFFQKLNMNINLKNFKNIIVIISSLFLISTIRIWMAPLVLLSMFIPIIFYYTFKRMIIFNKKFFLFVLFFVFIGLIFFLDTNIWNNIKIDFIKEQFNRVHNWHAWDPNKHNIIGVNAENIQQLLIYDFWKMMFLTLFNPFLNYYYELKFYPFIFENIVIIFLIFYSILNKDFKTNKNILFIFFITLGYSLLYAHAGGFLNPGTSLRYSLQIKYLIFIYLLSLNKKSLDILFYKFFIYLKNFYKQYVK